MFTECDSVLAFFMSSLLALLATSLYFSFLWDPKVPEGDLAPLWLFVTGFNICGVLLMVLFSYEVSSAELRASFFTGVSSFVILFVILSLDPYIFRFDLETGKESLSEITLFVSFSSSCSSLPSSSLSLSLSLSLRGPRKEHDGDL